MPIVESTIIEEQLIIQCTINDEQDEILSTVTEQPIIIQATLYEEAGEKGAKGDPGESIPFKEDLDFDADGTGVNDPPSGQNKLYLPPGWETSRIRVFRNMSFLRKSGYTKVGLEITFINQIGEEEQFTICEY